MRLTTVVALVATAAVAGATGAVLVCAYALGLEAQQHERETAEIRRIVDAAARPVGVYRPTAWVEDRWHA